MRGQHVISSAINLLEMIEGKYSQEEAEQLQKRLLSAIKAKDAKKFERGIKRIKESRNGK